MPGQPDEGLRSAIAHPPFLVGEKLLEPARVLRPAHASDELGCLHPDVPGRMCEQLVDARDGGVTGRDFERRRQELRIAARPEQLHGKGVAYVEFRDLGELQQVGGILVGRGADAAIERLADHGAARALQHVEHVSARPVAATRDLRDQPSHGARRVDRGQRFGSRDRHEHVGVVRCGGELRETVGIAQIAQRLHGHESRAEMRVARLPRTNSVSPKPCASAIRRSAAAPSSMLRV